MAFLLSQTDEYINQLTDMVKQHKKETRKKQREIKRQQRMEEMALDDSSMSELRAHVKEISTGKVLRGENAPLASELEAWLEKNPGYEEVPRDEYSDDDSDDEDKKKEGECRLINFDYRIFCV